MNEATGSESLPVISLTGLLDRKTDHIRRNNEDFAKCLAAAKPRVQAVVATTRQVLDEDFRGEALFRDRSMILYSVVRTSANCLSAREARSVVRLLRHPALGWSRVQSFLTRGPCRRRLIIYQYICKSE